MSTGSSMTSTSPLGGGRKWLQNSWCLPTLPFSLVPLTLRVLPTLSWVHVTKFPISFILLYLNHRKPKGHLSFSTLLHIPFTCRTSSISSSHALAPTTIHPAPGTVWLGPLGVTVWHLQSTLDPQSLLESSFPFSLSQSFLVNIVQFLRLDFYFTVFCSTTTFTIPNS